MFQDSTGNQYHFDDSGTFVDSEGKKPSSDFNLKDPKLAEWLHNHVQQILIDSFGLQRFTTRTGREIFITPNALSSPERLLVLICGSGRIYAGLWSVGVCIYHGLRAGSVIPMLEKARERQMEVIILNPNTESWGMFGNVGHAQSIFSDHVIPSNPKNVWVVAHSLGGEAALRVISSFPEWSISHIRAIALTDGVETRVSASGWQINRWSHEHVINWVCDDKAEPNSVIGAGGSAIHRSAGTRDHPLTTFAAFEYIWQFFDNSDSECNVDDFKGDEKIPFSFPHCEVC